MTLPTPPPACRRATDRLRLPDDGPRDQPCDAATDAATCARLAAAQEAVVAARLRYHAALDHLRHVLTETR